jgi:hypothetical protein
MAGVISISFAGAPSPIPSGRLSFISSIELTKVHSCLAFDHHAFGTIVIPRYVSDRFVAQAQKLPPKAHQNVHSPEDSQIALLPAQAFQSFVHDPFVRGLDAIFGLHLPIGLCGCGGRFKQRLH